ncbi:MAG TPA: hypothetical protein VK897_21010 [Anaerolineales bacterium]|nr:hypothetical protein [Anaerolineales bacterium]
MYRRDFLKLSGLLSASVLMRFNSLEKAVSLPLEAEAHGKLFRATSDGRIYVSTNRGMDWQLHTNFGSEVSVYGLASRHRDQVHAELGIANHSFQLALTPDGKRWRKV